ncbi:hypothetical protein [Dictyobacter kobayashii]|nr:hypothetical protein [Dictyobacter kobayashii]
MVMNSAYCCFLRSNQVDLTLKAARRLLTILQLVCLLALNDKLMDY